MISLLVFTHKPSATTTDIFRETRAISKATDKLTKENICSLSIWRNSFERGFGRFMCFMKNSPRCFQTKIETDNHCSCRRVRLINISRIIVRRNELTNCRCRTYVTTAKKKSFLAVIQRSLHVRAPLSN